MRNAGVSFRSSELVFGRHEKSAIEVLNFKIGLRVVLTARRRCRAWRTAPDNVSRLGYDRSKVKRTFLVRTVVVAPALPVHSQGYIFLNVAQKFCAILIGLLDS